MSLYFVGNNPYYTAINQNSITEANCYVCTSSEYELETALLVRDKKVKGISITATLNCINRLMFRLALVGTNLNPKFKPLYIESGVIKTSTSVQNAGVHFIREDNYTNINEQIQVNFPELNNLGVWEEFVEGDHYEVSGFVLSKEIYFRLPLKQTWDCSNSKILKYEAISLELLPLDKLREAVERLGLNYTFFNLELIDSADGWRLIECNPRLGEDARINKKELEDIVNDFISEFYGHAKDGSKQ